MNINITNQLDKYFLTSYYNQSFQHFLDREFTVPVSKRNERKIPIFILNTCSFQPLLQFSHFIKKLNLDIYLFDENKNNIEILQNEIKGEELEENIHFFSGNPFTLFYDFQSSERNLTNISFDFIIIHHTSIYDFKLNELLKELHKLLSPSGKLYFFYSICNSSSSTKNYLRNKIQKYTQLPIGNVKSIIDILESLESISYLYKKIHVNPFLTKKYPIFGEHTIYLFILQKLN